MFKKRDSLIAIKVCIESLRKWKDDPRIWTAALLVILFEWTKIQPVRQLCVEQGLSISNWFYPFLFSGTINTMFFFFGIILLSCDAPFIDKHQMFVVMRSGKKKWFIGKIIYIFVASFFYFAWMYLVSIFEFIPYVGISSEWEKILEGLSINGKVGYVMVTVPRTVIIQMTPMKAFGVSLILCILVGTFLGLLIFHMNLYESYNLGVSVALVVILATGVISVLPDEFRAKAQWISPVSWVNIEIFTLDHGGVSLVYAVSFLIIANSVLVALIMRKAKDYNVDSMEEL